MTNQGWVSNLTLEPQSRLTGGIVTGYITNHGYLEYVTIGEGVKLAAEVILGKGVQFSHPSDDPKLGSK
ncbi:hypothetical protein THII_3009 [Thioploca ingrica]|uniref:Uncharacterized protein n=1 Tax=Thioploca ingrica TaxID=40754 RepID=A0A090BVR3_9GAMM|nr:hypothetical protein THII_3009 [Thioploca ingrica]